MTAMQSNLASCLVHVPVTPFDATGRIDFGCLAKLVEFHIGQGAEALAVPMHVGESVSLTDAEKRKLIEAVIECVGGRVPVIAHASDAGTSIAASFASFAQNAGAAAVVSTTPYYWTPPQAMLVEHFAAIASAVTVPFFVHNAPEEMSGVKVDTGMMLTLSERAPNFAGVVDSGLDWQFMIELMTDAPKVLPNFQLISGTDLAVSARAIGSTGLFSVLSSIAPALVRRMHVDCAADRLFEARAAQEEVAALRQTLKASGIAGIKTAMGIMGRDVGVPRTPLRALGEDAVGRLRTKLARVRALEAEHRGW